MSGLLPTFSTTRLLTLFLLACLFIRPATGATALPPSVARASIAWPDADWAGELGSMPIGNGDVAGNVWIESGTGDLLFYAAKSDAFDANAQPVKVGRVRVSLDPPLYNAAAGGGGGGTTPADVSAYTAMPGTLGDPRHQIAQPNGAGVEWPATSHAECPQEAAATCVRTRGCAAFSCYTQPHNRAHSTFQLHTDAANTVGNESDWTFYRPKDAPPSPMAWSQTLDLATGAVRVRNAALGYNVSVLVDAHAPVVRVSVARAGGKPFSVAAALEIWRNATRRTALGRGLCAPRYDTPDAVLDAAPPALPGVVWAHQNVYPNGSSSVYADTCRQQGIDPGVRPDPFHNLVFGGHMGEAAAADGSGGAGGPARLRPDGRTRLVGSGLTAPLALEVTLHTRQTSLGAWRDGLAGVVAAQARVPATRKQAAHERWWTGFWTRSHVAVTLNNASAAAASAGGAYTAADALAVERHYVWQRYLDQCGGRGAPAPIKFNGQAFTVDTGRGPDYRDWGACYWFQNTRQPYYNALAAGDGADLLVPLLAFYARAIPYVEQRVRAQFNISGGYWPETMHQWGAYSPGDWGCGTAPAGRTGRGDAANTYVRFHTTGSLELALFALDHYDYTRDAAALARYGVPICRTLLAYYRSRYPRRDARNKTDMWPAQALETYQCPDPASRAHCATNPSTDIAGLGAVLSRLLALPAGVGGATPADRAAWRAQLEALPPLPQAGGAVLPVAPGYALGRHNAENVELYPVHPFRVFGLGKPGLPLAQATYAQRPFPCNEGWCLDVIAAAMLNLTAEATRMVVQRARQGAAKGWRFGGFAAHYQDYEPSADHYSFQRTAMHAQLLLPLDDARRRMLVMPTWDAEAFDVDFRLHAPLNTTVEAACVGGRLVKFVVTPAERAGDFEVVNCRRG